MQIDELSNTLIIFDLDQVITKVKLLSFRSNTLSLKLLQYL